MRFSSIFSLAPVPPAPADELALRASGTQDAAEPSAPAELPDDLDARVRLLGEWQLLEG